MEKRWRKFVVLTLTQCIFAVGLSALTWYFCNKTYRGEPKLLTIIILPMLALPAIFAASVFAVRKPGTILMHLIFLLLIIPGILLAETGVWENFSYYDYYKYAQTATTKEAEVCTLCLIIAVLGCYILLNAYTIKTAIKLYKIHLIVAALFTASMVTLSLNVKHISEGVKERFLSWYSPQEQAYLNQHVRGYFRDDWQKDSFLRVTSGGWDKSFDTLWINNSNKFQGIDQPSIWVHDYVDLQIDSKAQEAIEDAINIAIRDELWKQQDVLTGHMVCDAGPTCFSFQLGPY